MGELQHFEQFESHFAYDRCGFACRKMSADQSSGVHSCCEGVVEEVEGMVCHIWFLPAHEEFPELCKKHFCQGFRKDVSELAIACDRKDFDAVIAFTEVRSEPVMLDVPVLVACSES